MRRPALGVFLILWASYAFFWHARDWNTASRLMLTYSLVDRGTIRIDGLGEQTGDKASYGGHLYSDKLPGYSFLAAVPYAAFKPLMGFPDHPRDVPGIAHWAADYAVTLFTSGLLTALAGALLTTLAADLGCGPRRAMLVGLAYGLATPAYAYATLAHGHQTSAACLLGAFALLWRPDPGRSALPIRSALAGFLAASASTVELQVGPVAAILGLYALALAIGRRRPWGSVVAFGLGALGPTLALLAYDWIAFDSPFRMGYFFHATPQFAEVHSAANPLGLRRPDWSRVDDLLVRPARGLFWYAPIVVLVVPGLVALVARRSYGAAAVAGSTMAAVFLVNLSYPEWSGGWSTGPRLLVPLLPFAMLPVAGLLAVGGRASTAIAAGLALAGGGLIFLFQGVGARVPNPVPEPPPGVVDPLLRPLTTAVLPLWRGEPLPPWVFGQRFARNLVMVARPGWVAGLPESWRWLQFAPLLAFQAVAIGLLARSLRPPTPPAPAPTPVAGPPPATPDPASARRGIRADRTA